MGDGVAAAGLVPAAVAADAGGAAVATLLKSSTAVDGTAVAPSRGRPERHALRRPSSDGGLVDLIVEGVLPAHLADCTRPSGHRRSEMGFEV
jgi:hypothetical protein